MLARIRKTTQQSEREEDLAAAAPGAGSRWPSASRRFTPCPPSPPAFSWGASTVSGLGALLATRSPRAGGGGLLLARRPRARFLALAVRDRLATASAAGSSSGGLRRGAPDRVARRRRLRPSSSMVPPANSIAVRALRLRSCGLRRVSAGRDAGAEHLDRPRRARNQARLGEHVGVDDRVLLETDELAEVDHDVFLMPVVVEARSFGRRCSRGIWPPSKPVGSPTLEREPGPSGHGPLVLPVRRPGRDRSACAAGGCPWRGSAHEASRSRPLSASVRRDRQLLEHCAPAGSRPARRRPRPGGGPLDHAAHRRAWPRARRV